MSFYSEFAANYERVFPLREGTLAFLKARLPAGRGVLDLGCGTGHYAAALGAVGVDLDPAMIAAARARYPDTEFRVLDMREIAELDGPFSGAYCIGNVLPHLAPDDLAAFLRALRDLLAPDAPFLVQTVNFDRLLPLRTPYRFPDLDAGSGLVFRRAYLPAAAGAVRFLTELCDREMVLFAGEDVLWPLASRELISRCEAAGFALREHCADFVGAPFDAATAGASILVF
jgi:SAM-dependent methyltransferase